MILFEGNDRLAYRDPACYWHDGMYHLFFTVSEKENGFLYNRVAVSHSADLKKWSEPCMLTPKNLRLNYCSPGNVIRHDGHFVLCLTSYPMPFPYAQQYYADETARLFTMSTADFVHFTDPLLLNPKGCTPPDQLGRMIDPFILPVTDGYFLFYKQNGVSCSFSRDLKMWEDRGRTDGGENACVLPWQHGYLLVHSPENGIAFALSKDLKTWTPCGHTVLNQPRWPWAEGRLTAGFLMQAPPDAPHRYLLFFHGSRNVFPETHGNASLAMVYTDDLTTFFGK